MYASKVTLDVLESAASKLGLRIETTTLNAKGTRHRVKVYPEAFKTPELALTPAGNRKRGEAGDRVYQRLSPGFHDERRVHAVCWHGFRDYFREVFKVAPDAVFRTSIDTWKGAEDFEARYRESGHRNVGAPIAPRMMAEVCRCGEQGMAV